VINMPELINMECGTTGRFIIEDIRKQNEMLNKAVVALDEIKEYMTGQYMEDTRYQLDYISDVVTDALKTIQVGEG